MTDFTELQRNSDDLDALVNENRLVATRYGGSKKSWQYLQDEFSAEFAEQLLEINKSRGFRVVGTFAAGFDYELFNDVGIDAAGNSWVYVGTGAPAKNVTAGTVPSAPDYKQVTYNDHSAMVNRDSDDAHPLNAITDSQKPQDEIIAGSVFPSTPQDSALVGDTVPANTTHIRFGGEVLRMTPQAAGEITAITNTGATIGGVDVQLTNQTRGVFCSVRQSAEGGGWSFIDDSAHAPIGAESLSVNASGNLQINYDYTAGRVGAVSVVADELYSKAGVRFGASVGVSNLIIEATGAIDGVVSGASNAGILTNTGLSPKITQVVDGANGTISVTHRAQTNTQSYGSAVLVSRYNKVDKGELVVTSQTKTGFNLQYKENLEGVFTNPSGTPTITTQVVGVSVSVSGGIITITHPTINSQNKHVSIQSQGAHYLFNVQTNITGSSFSVQVFDPSNLTTPLTTIPSTVRFSFSRNAPAPAALPATVFASIRRDDVGIHMDDIYNSSGNIWVMAEHEV